ncbi:MAG TPA: PDZ domain-containing protein, partial [Roseiflexaceae bacterium]|nr:PDZ domain-containing protein [Roseiflexaceae bacterium]
MSLRLVRILLLGLLALSVGACSAELPRLPQFVQAPSATPLATATAQPSATALPSATPQPTDTPQPSATPVPSNTPTPLPTVEPLPPTPTLVALGQEQRAAIFDRVWRLVRDRYVYPDYGGLDWNAVRTEFEPRVAAAATAEDFYGLMYELIERLGDDHSRFESPRDVAEGEAEFEGELRYAGIGVQIRETDEGALITRIAKPGPASDAGLQKHDLIVAIGGVPFTDTARFGPAGPIGAVRGTPGTLVNLTIRSANGATREVMVMRQAISADAFARVEGQMLPGSRIALLRIDTFYAEGIVEDVRAELDRLGADGPLDGLIIDVRENGGG